MTYHNLSPEQTLSDVKSLGIMKIGNNSKTHRGTSTSETKTRCRRAQEVSDSTNAISEFLPHVARRQMFGIFALVIRIAKIHVGCSVSIFVHSVLFVSIGILLATVR